MHSLCSIEPRVHVMSRQARLDCARLYRNHAGIFGAEVCRPDKLSHMQSTVHPNERTQTRTSTSITLSSPVDNDRIAGCFVTIATRLLFATTTARNTCVFANWFRPSGLKCAPVKRRPYYWKWVKTPARARQLTVVHAHEIIVRPIKFDR